VTVANPHPTFLTSESPSLHIQFQRSKVNNLNDTVHLVFKANAPEISLKWRPHCISFANWEIPSVYGYLN
jgi:hypothetical protein